MDKNKYMADENEALRRENEHLRCRITKAEDFANKSRKEYEISKGKIKELEWKIRFLEGQIEAYQYCANCKR